MFAFFIWCINVMASAAAYGLVPPGSGIVIPVTSDPNSTIPTLTHIPSTIVNKLMENADSRSFADNEDCRCTVVLKGTIRYIVTIGNGIQESCFGSYSLQDLGVIEQSN
ncbi:hypothetical protein CHS0354_002589 [Potamilus streckersoni]|uniref:Uncharacterized protein n=1 Tax=Potamilus streckersoni TaxID=2493646 RepID=A0AAE0RP97_9BIVA|nr:hypothetical protein CHS0354_002589 [Potamilus streckersoni]